MEAKSIDVHKDTENGDSLVLITNGRYTGRSEAALLTYKRYHGEYVIVAINERRRTKPDWYLNLKEEPVVQVELAGTSFYAQARTPTGQERLRLLPIVSKLAGGFGSEIPRETSAILLAPIG
jgi:deazaflavin-dependent oxidoreductase (nitroreductase family)